MLVWQTGGGKSGNGIFALGKFKVYLSHSKVADVRVHDQLHSETEGLARTIHDEQCSRKFHNFTGENQSAGELDAKSTERVKLNDSFFSICKQVVSNRETNETLLCIAYVFEVANSNCGAQHHIYRLVKDQSQH